MGKYDSSAHVYDDRYSKIQGEKLDYIFKDFSFEDKLLLDAGCGTGLFHDFFLEHLPINSEKRYHLLGADISWNMLKIFLSKSKAKITTFRNQVNLVLADMENLPFRNNTFHVFISLTSLQNLPNIINGMNESFRVTRNNGEVKFSILKKKLDLDEVLAHIKLRTKDLEVIENDFLEDIVLKFNLHKMK